MDNLFDGLENLGFKNLDNIELFKKEPANAMQEQKTALVKKMNQEECLYDKTYKCTVCDTSFKERTVKKGKVRLLSSDSDFRPYYDVLDPLFYDVVVCQCCGYAALSAFFEKLTYTQAKWIKGDISHKYKPREYPATFTVDIAIERYKLALLNAVAKKAKDSEKAYICMKIAWLYRTKAEEKKELAFIDHTYTGFKEAFTKERFPICGLDEHTMTYLIGEFARRLGHTDEALRWFSNVIVARSANERLRERAKDQKDLIRQEQQKVANGT